MGKGDIFRKQRREFEPVKREVKGLKAGMGIAKGWAGYVGIEDSPHPYSDCIPLIPFSGAERGSGQGPSPAGKGKGWQATKGTGIAAVGKSSAVTPESNRAVAVAT